MSRSPTFSVLVPMRNAAATVGEALRSVRAQTLGDWEAVVVDDGSDDGSAEIVERIAAEDGRVRLCRHAGGAHRGTPATRNLTVTEARGGLLAFLDADDLLVPDALEAYAAAFERHRGASVVYGQAETFGAGKPARLGRGLPDRPARMLRQLASDNALATSATAVRAAAVPPAPFPPWMRLSQDWALWVQLAWSCSFVFLDRVTCRYRVHAGGVTARMRAAGREVRYAVDQARFLRELLEDARAGRGPARGMPGDARGERIAAVEAGLEDRATRAALRAASAARRGRLVDAARWTGAARAIAPSFGSFLRAARRAPAERRRMLAGHDPPLLAEPFAQGSDGA